MQWTTAQRYRALNADTQAEYQTLCQQAAQSRFRQWFHIQPPAGLLNDPNGFCYHQGKYHLFYQWFPLGAVHGLKYWHHLISQDLVHFTSLGIGIAPDTLEDSHGAYSGSAISQGDNLLIAYTGNHRTADWTRIPYQRIAVLSASGELRKQPPFLADAPSGYTEHTRDPKLWQAADGSYGMVLGAQRSNRTGTALYLSSGDGLSWQLQGEIDCGLPNFGYMWECPDYFSLSGKDFLFFCPQGLADYPNLYQCGYLSGHFDHTTLRFNHNGFQELDHGFEYYAVQTCLSPNAERLSIAWFGLPDMSCPTAQDGWAHCLTLPRVLSFENGQLYQRPLPALQQLRGSGESDGIHYELLLDNPDSAAFQLVLRQSDTEQTRLSYDGTTLTFDRTHSGLLPEPEIAVSGIKGGHIRRLAIAQLNHLQIFSDTSSLEIFINHGQYVMSGRIYPQSAANGITTELAASASLSIYPLQEAQWHSTPSAKP